MQHDGEREARERRIAERNALVERLTHDDRPAWSFGLGTLLGVGVAFLGVDLPAFAQRLNRPEQCTGAAELLRTFHVTDYLTVFSSLAVGVLLLAITPLGSRSRSMQLLRQHPRQVRATATLAIFTFAMTVNTILGHSVIGTVCRLRFPAATAAAPDANEEIAAMVFMLMIAIALMFIAHLDARHPAQQAAALRQETADGGRFREEQDDRELWARRWRVPVERDGRRVAVLAAAEEAGAAGGPAGRILAAAVPVLLLAGCQAALLAASAGLEPGPLTAAELASAVAGLLFLALGFAVLREMHVSHPVRCRDISTQLSKGLSQCLALVLLATGVLCAPLPAWWMVASLLCTAAVALPVFDPALDTRWNPPGRLAWLATRRLVVPRTLRHLRARDEYWRDIARLTGLEAEIERERREAAGR